MRYHMTDFFQYEQPKIDQLRAEGKFVYALVDTYGSSYVIKERAWCNRFGFLVTDEKLPLGDDGMTDSEFMKLDGVDDYTVCNTVKDVSAEVKAKQFECAENNKYLTYIHYKDGAYNVEGDWSKDFHKYYTRKMIENYADKIDKVYIRRRAER